MYVVREGWQEQECNKKEKNPAKQYDSQPTLPDKKIKGFRNSANLYDVKK